ncbi:hypothetical protein Arno162_102 [Pectobacterium phage Arno162]|uniref:Uncharacterized protein n=1 Tax=Pectobacterium phage Arno162 TaxID=2500577 RepID=A0A678ZRK4_9CAUD|nr:hypothetical protein Arno162_102 [Pectobacterium phage Arno162]
METQQSIALIILLIIIGFLGWSVIETLRWLFSFVHITIGG